MIFGTGFAPFRGGPLHYARARGVGNVLAALALADKYGERVRPDPAGRSLHDRAHRIHRSGEFSRRSRRRRAGRQEYCSRVAARRRHDVANALYARGCRSVDQAAHFHGADPGEAASQTGPGTPVHGAGVGAAVCRLSGARVWHGAARRRTAAKYRGRRVLRPPAVACTRPRRNRATSRQTAPCAALCSFLAVNIFAQLVAKAQRGAETRFSPSSNTDPTVHLSKLRCDGALDPPTAAQTNSDMPFMPGPTPTSAECIRSRARLPGDRFSVICSAARAGRSHRNMRLVCTRRCLCPMRHAAARHRRAWRCGGPGIDPAAQSQRHVQNKSLPRNVSRFPPSPRARSLCHRPLRLQRDVRRGL